VLIPVHGKIPLVVSETCFIREHSYEEEPAGKCKFLCSKDHWLTRTAGDWSLKDTGRMTLSGSDLCMLEHADDWPRQSSTPSTSKATARASIMSPPWAASTGKC